MTKSLSMDLHERIVARIEGGESRWRTAALFGVSVGSAIHLAQRKRDTGSIAPKKRGRPAGSGKLSTHAISSLPKNACSATNKLRARSTCLSRYKCRNFFDAAGYISEPN